MQYLNKKLDFNRRGLLVVLTVLVLFGTVFSFPAISHAGTGLSIQPVKISETLSPGQTVTGSILLTNASDGPVNVEVNLEDFVPIQGADSIQFVGRTAGVTSVKDWITVGSKQIFKFEVGESKQIPYTIKAPDNAEPGGHFGVVFFKATPANTPTGSLKIGTQVGMLVLVAIPGNHLQKGKILDFNSPGFVQSGPVPFAIKFQNTGTVHYEPKGKIVISNMFGKKVAEVPIDGQVVLPTSIKTLNENWNVSGLFLGRYTAVASIVDGEGEVLTTKSINFWAFPVWYFLAFLVTMIVLFFIFRFIKSRVRISLV
jgi:hypothetical protein